MKIKEMKLRCNVCELFTYRPKSDKYKLTKYICIHPEFDNKKTKYKMVNKKCLLDNEPPDWCPKNKEKK